MWWTDVRIVWQFWRELFGNAECGEQMLELFGNAECGEQMLELFDSSEENCLVMLNVVDRC